MSMKIALATDHAGFEQLNDLIQYLTSLGYDCHNYGPATLDPDDDYPDFIFAAAEAVAKGDCDRGIIFGGSGQGEAMAANRVKGVRCTVFYGPVKAQEAVDAEGTLSDDPFIMLRLSREHNDANMLSLAARFLSLDEIKAASQLWLELPGASAERHIRRNRKLDNPV
jgi:ribose 5-phosphate isomerase B